MKKLRENQKYQRKPKTTKNTFGKTKKTKFLKVSDPPLDMGLVLFGFLVFPKVFRKPKKPSGKPKIPKKTKENQKYFRENQKITGPERGNEKGVTRFRALRGP